MLQANKIPNVATQLVFVWLAGPPFVSQWLPLCRQQPAAKRRRMCFPNASGSLFRDEGFIKIFLFQRIHDGLRDVWPRPLLRLAGAVSCRSRQDFATSNDQLPVTNTSYWGATNLSTLVFGIETDLLSVNNVHSLIKRIRGEAGGNGT